MSGLRKPANIALEEAATIPTSALAALHALRDVGEVLPGQKALIVLKEMVESEKLRPIIGKTCPLRETPAALSYIEEGHARGKVVIIV